MNVLDLFSGIGGFSLGLERAGMKTIAFCEIEPFCQKVLKKHWPDVPLFSDIFDLNKEKLEEVYDGTVDLICGGFPCQPFSVAGKREGKNDDRHLWPEMFRLIKELRPAWVIGENVSGFVNMALDDTLSDLESIGYSCQAFVIPACAVGAPHRRDRVWIVGNAAGEQSGRVQQRGLGTDFGAGSQNVGDSISIRPQRQSWGGTGAQPEDGHMGMEEGNVADTEGELRKRSRPARARRARFTNDGADVADTNKQGIQRSQVAGSIGASREDADQHSKRLNSPSVGWAAQSGLGRDSHGLSNRLHGHWPAGLGQSQYDWEPPRVAKGVKDRVGRLKALGNAVVPQIPEIIGRAIMEVHHDTPKR